MKRIMLVALWLTLSLLLTPQYAQAQDDATPAAHTAAWSKPTVLYPEEWPHPRYASFNDAGSRLVALIPNSGASDASRHIVVSELRGSAWQEPVVLAQNGAYSDAGSQFLPQRTHPIMSGDGRTIAYIGFTGTTYGVYLSTRGADGVWSAPTLLNTGLPNTHYWIALSRNGNTLALSDYPFAATQHLYVLARTNGVWSAPVRVSRSDGPLQGGWTPSLSEDGSRLVFVANAQVMYSQRTADGWMAPVALTNHDAFALSAEYPQLSGDGMSIRYWLVTLTPSGGAQVRTAQNLYSLWWKESGWETPRLVNATPVLPSSVTEGPAFADRSGTRIVYARPITATDPGSDWSYVWGSHLEVSEWFTGTWQTTRLVTAEGEGNLNRWPRLMRVGAMVVFDAGVRYSGTLPVNGALWQLSTTIRPPIPPYRLSLTDVLSAAGSSLFSPFDGIRYLFGPGTFTQTITVTHSYWADPPAPPPGQTPIGGIGGIGGGLGGAFVTTLLGPGGLPVQPLRPVTITVDYSNTDTGTAIPGTLNLWWRDANQWVKLPSIDDPAAGAVMAPVSHFSHFAIFGETNHFFLPVIVRQEEVR